MIHIEFTTDAAQELIGRQSVRTTFRISERARDTLSVLALQLGIRQKSLFDHLMADQSVLTRIAEDAESYEPPEHRVPKTFVVSRKTLQTLEAVSQGFGVPRDMLVEVSIERIFPLLEQEREKHRQRKQIQEKMQALLQQGREAFALVDEALDRDDPVYRRALQMLRAINACCGEVDESVMRGQRMEDM